MVLLSGKKPEFIKCPRCHGIGTVPSLDAYNPLRDETCNRCDGYAQLRIKENGEVVKIKE